MAINKGAGALGALNSQGGGGNQAEITPLKSGTTLKVRVKGTQDIAQYYGYSVFKKVYTFVPEKPATRNDRGFIESGHTPWDLAAQYYFDKAKDAATEAEAEDLKQEGRKYRGKERYLLGFYDLTAGKDIVVDLTKQQAQAVHETIAEYAEDDQYAEMAFKLAKKGESTSTTVSLNPIVNTAKGLTDEERANFDASADQPFDDTLFDNVLYEADEAEQIEKLKQAGFDVSLIGLAPPTESAQPAQAEGADPTQNF